jgi:hypothetical protein
MVGFHVPVMLPYSYFIVILWVILYSPVHLAAPILGSELILILGMVFHSPIQISFPTNSVGNGEMKNHSRYQNGDLFLFKS